MYPSRPVHTHLFVCVCLQAKKEAELRELAMRARNERAGGLAARMDGGIAAAPAAAAAGGCRPSSGCCMRLCAWVPLQQRCLWEELNCALVLKALHLPL